MSFWPVVSRELKSQARQPLTYWLRVLGGACVAGAFATALWRLNDLKDPSQGGSIENAVLMFGTALFGKLNLFMFLAIWVGEIPAYESLAGIASGFCAFPIIGLFFSMHRLNFFVAWLLTCAAGLLPIAIIKFPLNLELLVVAGLFAGALLEYRLRNRRFLTRLA